MPSSAWVLPSLVLMSQRRSLARPAALRLPPGAGVDDLLDEVLVGLDARHAEDDVAVPAARIHPRHHPA